MRRWPGPEEAWPGLQERVRAGGAELGRPEGHGAAALHAAVHGPPAQAATLDPYPSAITALLPCPLTYQRLFSDKDPADGTLPHVLSSSSASASDSTKLCKAWVEHYGSPSYRAYVNKWCSIIDDVAAEASDAELAAMRREFDLATRMECLFWDMAWERRGDWGLEVQRF